jgi:predicted RNA-binding Zn-ribbon protein involved in translation (DUF1610 family)
MTDTAIARNARNARTNREGSKNAGKYKGPGARSHVSRDEMIIKYGVTKRVIVPKCPNCGYDLQMGKVEIQTIYTRFKCPECGVSIANTKENRCRVCFLLCSDSETYNAHKWGGCPNAGTLYPFKGMLVMRDENPKEKVVV